MHPGTPRDVDLEGWLQAASFHPADTPMKQMGHELARQLIALLGTHLHQLLPPGREKALVFTDLERVRLYANMALAVHGGPRAEVDEGALRDLLDETRRVAGHVGGQLNEDPRIGEYKAGQLGEPAPVLDPPLV